MNPADELSRLFAAERAEQPAATAAATGWQALDSALKANLPGLAVAHGPLKLGLSLATKSFVGSSLIAFAVTTAGLGVHAALQPEIRATPSVDRPYPPPLGRQATPRPEAQLPSPTPQAASVPPKAQPQPSSSSKEQVSTFTAELRLIKAAKQELDAGRPHLADVWLDQHEQLYPNGVFRKERESLRERLRNSTGPEKNLPETPTAK